MRLPEVKGCPLPVLLATRIIDTDVFSTGWEIMSRRYERLGVRVLLPLERVWAGTRSAAAPGTARGCGGFHHPGQGYRHLQMDAAVTVYGDLTGQSPACPQATALDLLRSFAHDCLHFATFRRYELTDRGEIARVQYGINLRRPDGRTYSAPDAPGESATRNLGILMEGATDTEATFITRQAAAASGIGGLDAGGGLPGWVFADATGTLVAGSLQAALSSALSYARSLGRFNCAVTVRYQALLRELADDPGEPHEQFVMAMISGNRAPLESWLDARHGSGCFARRFRAASFDAPAEGVS